MPLSSKQMEYLALAWTCFETEPKIDYAKFAKLANLASPASARELMRVTKNKLKAEYGAGGLQSASEKSSTPKKSTAKKNGDAGSACTSATGTPAASATKKRGRTPSRKAREAEEDREGDEEESPTKKVKGGVVKKEMVGDGDDLDDMFQ
ncbi:hypothetical protein LTR08_005692 [Meristemomyces frigidus]|nr:hypothetical protein LTR08_005692 [Meristemomyces frigidus]